MRLCFLLIWYFSRYSVIFDVTRLGLLTLVGMFTGDMAMIVYGLASMAAVAWLESTGCISSVEKQKSD